MATPPSGTATPEGVGGFDAVELFAVRAAEVDPAFALTSENAGTVGAICRRLDGVPLAIELAAALVRILAPNQILERLDDRFDLLTGGSAGGPAHHQTLRAALDSTFELLDAERREFAARLAVFVGGFDLAAAEAVASGGTVGRGSVVEALSALADRSLLARADNVDGVRFHIPESVREYLVDRLRDSGELLVRRLAHAKHYSSLVGEASQGLRGPDQARWDARLEADIENVRSAIDFCASTGDEDALLLASRMFLYWRTRGDWSDGLHWTRLALDNSFKRDSPLRARMLATAGFFASDLGDAARGLPDLEEGLAMARRTGDRHAIGYCSSFLGAELSRRDLDLDRGLELLSEAKGIYSELGEPYGEAWVNRYLALSYQERGELEEAIALHERSLRSFTMADDAWNVRFAQTLLAEALHTVADLERSRELYEESLRGPDEARFRLVIAHGHKGIGKVSLAEGKLDEAAEHLAIAGRALREIGDVACAAETAGHQAMVDLGRHEVASAGDRLRDALRQFDAINDAGGVAWTLERLASARAADRDFPDAARLLGASVGLRIDIGAIRPPVDQPDVDRLASQLAEALGAETQTALEEEGAGLSYAAAVALADA